MATPAPAPLMPSVPLSLKRPVIFVAVIGVLALAVTVYIGRPLLGGADRRRDASRTAQHQARAARRRAGDAPKTTPVSSGWRTRRPRGC